MKRMNAMELRYGHMEDQALSEAMYGNEETFRMQRKDRDEAGTAPERELTIHALMETERERQVILKELRKRGRHVPPFQRNQREPMALHRHTERPGLPVTGTRLPIVGYRQIRGDDDRVTVTAVVTTLENGIWRSDLMRLSPDTAACIQSGLTGEDSMDVLNRMYREKRERLGKQQ